jgi:hypothetical protein
MRVTPKAIAKQQKRLRRPTTPSNGDWFQNVQNQEPLRQQLQNGSPETSTGWVPRGRGGLLETAYRTAMTLGAGIGAYLPQVGGPSAAPGTAGGNSLSGETALAAHGLYAQLTSNRNVPFAPAQNAAPVRVARSTGDHIDDSDPDKFMHDLDHERTFYTMLFSPGLKKLGYDPGEKFEYDVTERDGSRITEERKTLTAVGVVRYLLVRKVEKLQGLTQRGRDLVFEVQRHKGKQANKLFRSKEALKKVQHRSVHRGVKAIERLLETQGVKGTDKATLRVAVARSRFPSSINLTYREEGNIGAVLDVETSGGTMSFAILPTTDELIRYLGDADGRDNWVARNGETAFFSSDFNFRDSALFTTAVVEGTEDQPLDTVSSCLRHMLLPVINDRIVRRHGIPRVLLE